MSDQDRDGHFYMLTWIASCLAQRSISELVVGALLVGELAIFWGLLFAVVLGHR
jgi:hypothetical protein